MKTRTVFSTAVLAIVALALTIPAIAQSTANGTSTRWQIGLTGATARTSGIADYTTSRAALAPPATAKGRLVVKFTVETISPDVADGGKLSVFLGPSTVPNEPYGKLVGSIDVNGGLGVMALIGAKVPHVQRGTIVTIVGASPTPGEGQMMLQGTF